MGALTKIEWCDHTFNPWWGCAHVSPGCVHCYAETFAKRTGHDVWGAHGPRRLFGDKHWSEPHKWNRTAQEFGTPALVFCASMADVFEEHPALPDQRERLWELIVATPYLTWLLLTKRPENIEPMRPREWAYRWPENVWLGTTVEDQQRADERIPVLLEQKARVRFLSCEPLLGPVDLLREPEDCDPISGIPHPWIDVGGVDWVICGGESGPKARPMHPDWARLLRDQAVAAGVPFLFKQWGDWRHLIEAETPGGSWGPYPDVPVQSMWPDGRLSLDAVPESGVSACMQRVGKKRAGRELDGRTWNERPEAVSA